MTLEKDIFVVGENIRLRFNCDNTKCRKTVESMTLKLQRTIQATALAGGNKEDGTATTSNVKFIKVHLDS